MVEDLGGLLRGRKHVSVSADLWVLCDFSSGAGTPSD